MKTEEFIKMLNKAIEDQYKSVVKDLWANAPDSHMLDAMAYALGPITYPSKFLKPKSCNHNWQAYKGFSESYDYCILCDEKRK